MSELIEAAARSRDPDMALFIRLAVVAGARRGELSALRWSDIELEDGRLTIARSIVDDSNEKLIEKETNTPRIVALFSTPRRWLCSIGAGWSGCVTGRGGHPSGAAWP